MAAAAPKDAKVSEDQKKAVEKALEAKKKADPSDVTDEPKVAAVYQGTADQLKFEMAKDKTKKGMERRMSKEKLEQQGILKTAQADVASQLEKAKAADQVAKTHRRRESVEDLKAKGIIKTPNDAKADELQKAMNADKLNKKLADPQRPSKDQVEEKSKPVQPSDKEKTKELLEKRIDDMQAKMKSEDSKDDKK